MIGICKARFFFTVIISVKKNLLASGKYYLIRLDGDSVFSLKINKLSPVPFYFVLFVSFL